MTPGLRRAGLACAVLVVVAALFLFSRLDSGKLLLQLTQHARQAGMTLTTTGAAFSPMNGLSLRLDNLTLEGHGIHVRARTVFISSSWRALLSGNFAPDSAFLNTADIAVDHMPSPTMLLPSLPPLDRLSVSKSTLILRDSGLKLEDLQLDVRNIVPNHDMRWELLSRVGGEPLTSHGEAHLGDRTIETAFAKVKMTHVPLTSLALPHSWSNLAFTHASSTLTINLTANGQWDAFGELRLHPSPANAEPLVIRTKLQGSRAQWLAWRDTYIDFGNQNVIRSDGVCRTRSDCSGRFSGHNIALQSALRLLQGRHDAAASSGNVDFSATAAWKAHTLSGSLQGSWRNLRFGAGKLPIPAANWQLQQFDYQPGRQLQLSRLTVSPVSNAGNITLSRFQHDADGTRYALQLNDSATLWRSLASIGLHYAQLPAELQGNGTISGEIHAEHTADNSLLRFDIDASEAALRYGTRFDKAARVHTTVHGLWLRQAQQRLSTLTLNDSELAGSRISHLVWRHSPNGDALQLTGASLDFTTLAASGIQLPIPIPALAGNVTGDISGRWRQATGLQPDWHALNGALQLHAFIWEGHRWDGAIAIRDGIASSKALNWRQDSALATLHGHIDLASHSGTLNIVQATLGEPSLPEITAIPLKLHGSIQQMQYHLADNTVIADIHGRYHLTANGLTLERSEGRLAGGTIRADTLAIKPGDHGLLLTARLHIDRVQLSRIEQWPAWLQARPFGRCFANMQIEGPLATNRWPEWRGNGDLAIFSGGWIPLAQQAANAAQVLPGEPKRFQRIELRFKLEQKGLLLPQISIRRNNRTLQGSGHMMHQGLIKLELSEANRQRPQTVEGQWPNIDLPLN